MDYLQTFILGLSSGIACISVCLPGVLPILLGRRTTVAQSARFVAVYLSGRWCAYLIAAVITAMFASAIYDVVSNKIVMIATQFLLATIMILFAVGKLSSKCINPLKHKHLRTFLKNHESLLPVIMGFITSVSLCPPFVTLVLQTAGEQSLMRTVGLFTMFFIGTLPYFLPVPLVGLSRRNAVFKVIGRYTAAIMGCVYIYNAIKLIYNA